MTWFVYVTYYSDEPLDALCICNTNMNLTRELSNIITCICDYDGYSKKVPKNTDVSFELSNMESLKNIKTNLLKKSRICENMEQCGYLLCRINDSWHFDRMEKIDEIY